MQIIQHVLQVVAWSSDLLNSHHSFFLKERDRDDRQSKPAKTNDIERISEKKTNYIEA